MTIRLNLQEYYIRVRTKMRRAWRQESILLIQHVSYPSKLYRVHDGREELMDLKDKNEIMDKLAELEADADVDISLLEK